MPVASVPVTGRVFPEVTGNCVAPLLQTYEAPPPLAESSWVDEPQMGAETEAGEMVGATKVGDILNTTVLLVAVQPEMVLVVVTV